jgi:hypothetical protein
MDKTPHDYPISIGLEADPQYHFNFRATEELEDQLTRVGLNLLRLAATLANTDSNRPPELRDLVDGDHIAQAAKVLFGPPSAPPQPILVDAPPAAKPKSVDLPAAGNQEMPVFITRPKMEPNSSVDWRAIYAGMASATFSRREQSIQAPSGQTGSGRPFMIPKSSYLS